MPGGLAHVLDVACADALLAGGDPAPGRNLLACEVGLQGSHAGIYDQQAVVVVGHQGKALHFQMFFALEEIQVHSSQFVYAVWFHVFFLPVYRKPLWDAGALDACFFLASIIHDNRILSLDSIISRIFILYSRFWGRRGKSLPESLLAVFPSAQRAEPGADIFTVFLM